MTNNKSSREAAKAPVQAELYATLLDSIPFPIGVRNFVGKVVYMNKAALAFCGVESLAHAVHGETDNWADRLRRLPDGMYPRLVTNNSHFCVLRSDDSQFFLCESYPLKTPGGDLIGSIETIENVSNLFENNERMRIMLHASPLASWIHDSEYRVIDCNLETPRLFRASSKEEFIANFPGYFPIRQARGGLSRELSKGHMDKAFAEGYHKFEWLFTINGEPVPCEITLIREQYRGSAVILSYARDLREIKSAKAKLDAERLLLGRILESSPICFLISIDNVVRFITPFTTEFLGLKEGDDILGMHIETSQAMHIIDEVRRNGSVSWLPVSIRVANGEAKMMLLNAFAAEYYGEKSIMAWLMDVTEMNRKEGELRHARAVAEANAKAKSEFLANMSHEIRTPMSAIIGLTRLALEEGPLTTVQREYITQAELAAETLLGIINDILDFSKIEAGKIEMEAIDFHFANVLRNLMSVVGNRAIEKGLDILFNFSPDLPSALRGDPTRLGQILSNLFTNAVKFTFSGELVLSTSIAEEDADTVLLRFAVRDTGIGMDREQIEQIFAPFKQGDASTARVYGGSGLGLAISKHMIELMGGRIDCRSRRGVGSEFIFTARFGKVDDCGRYLDPIAHLADMAVLLVSSSPAARTLWGQTLDSLGPKQVVIVDSWERLAEMLEGGGRPVEPHGIILDYDSRTPPGFSVVTKVATILSTTRTPTILMIEPMLRERMLASMPKGENLRILTKPVLPDTVKSAVLRFRKAHSSQASDSAILRLGEYDLLRPLKGARILVAEDNAVNQLVIRRTLEKADFRVDVVTNGVEAIKKVDEEKFDLVLMDIQMPEMDGLTAAREIRKNPAHAKLPIVALTAYAMHTDIAASHAAGMNGHITKPVNRRELFQTLIQWIQPKDPENP